MIRRTFKLDYGDDDDQSLQVLVTYDPTTDVVLVATREFDYDAWSRPLPLTGSDDDPVGRTGSPGNRNDPAALVAQMRSLVEAYDDATAPDLRPDDLTPREPADGSTAMQNDQARELPRA